MPFVETHLLSLILFLPAIAAVILLVLPREAAGLHRWFTLLASLVLWAHPSACGCGSIPMPWLQFENYAWYGVGSEAAPGRGRAITTMVL
jgi:NADH:ubiquinone oxidoreductase subunit 4 (subunit M)